MIVAAGLIMNLASPKGWSAPAVSSLSITASAPTVAISQDVRIVILNDGDHPIGSIYLDVLYSDGHIDTIDGIPPLASTERHTITFTPSRAGTCTVTAYGTGGGGAAVTSASITITVAEHPLLDPTVRGAVQAQVSFAERSRASHTGNVFSHLRHWRNGALSSSLFGDFNLGVTRTGPARPASGAAQTARPDAAVVLSGAALASLPGDARAAADCVSKPWSLWGESYVNVGDDDKQANNDYTTYGFTTGFDYVFDSRFLAGFGLGYGRDRTDIGDDGSQSRGHAYTALLYGSYAATEAVYLDLILGYSRFDFDLRRRTAAGMARGDRDGDQYFASLAAGYEYRPRERLLLSPYARFDAAATRLDGFGERGAGDSSLVYGKTDADMLATTLGMRGEYAIPMRWGVLVPEAAVEYTRNFQDVGDTHIGYAAQGAAPYRMSLNSFARNVFSPSIGVSARFHNSFNFAVDYRGAFAKKRRDHLFSVHLGWEW